MELLEPSIQENCISYANPSDKIIRNQTFCCCASNLCNQNIYFTSKRNPFVEHKTEQSHIPKPNIRPKIQNRTAKYSFLTPGELNAILITSLVFLFLFALAFAIFWVFRKKLFFLKNHKYNLPTVFFSQQNSQVNSSSPSFRPNNHQEPRSIELHNPGLAINHTKDEMINEYLNFNNKIKQNNPLINTEELKSLTQPLLGESQGVFPSALVAPNIDIPENLFRHSNQMKPSFNFPDLVIRNDLKELEDVKASLEKQLLGKENFKDSNPELLNAILNPRQLQTSDIYLIEKISQGQFSSVWKARCLNSKNDNSPEAPEYGVKVFSGNQKSAWTNEKDIYNSLSTTNPNILKYFCSDIHELTKSEQQQNSFFPFCTNEYWIITEYHPNGSLYDYLKVNELSWQQMVKIANSILEGLAYLHSENAENRKPFAIAHRDLKSKNILVKNDGQSCCIADFGLALKLTSNNKLNSAEIRSKVGTRRYMSPELIEGAIAFTKETFLSKLNFYLNNFLNHFRCK